MDKRSRNLIIGLLAVVLTAALVWGVVESVQRRAYRLHLNAMLERSFYVLVGGLGDLGFGETSEKHEAESDEDEE